MSSSAVRGGRAGADWKSRSSIGTSPLPSRRGTLPENPFPAPASSRPPRNCTESAMISTAWRFCPSWLSPLAPLEPAVDRDRAALGQVAGAVLALRAPDGDVEVVGLVLPLAGAALAPRVARDPQAADGHAARQRAQLRVAVRLPVITTRLMLVAAIAAPFGGRCSAANECTQRPVVHPGVIAGKWGETSRRRRGARAQAREIRYASAPAAAGSALGSATAAARRAPAPSAPAAAGVPGVTLMIRWRTTPSVILRL